MPEGNGTVLDNCCRMFISNMFSGSRHDNRKVPGGLGGTFQTGRLLDYLNAGDHNRKLGRFYFGIMDWMGVRLGRCGDADTRLNAF